MSELGIFILPSEPHTPPRAVLIDQVVDMGPVDLASGNLATWSQDMGMWFVGSLPVPASLNEAITQHARSLGIDL